MIKVRKAAQRGLADFGWLKSRHTFSFGNYYDKENMGFRVLRVINEDRVESSKGFGTHAHENMEIITYVLKGALEHKDSMGNGSILSAGELQRMSAGSGIEHSEFNPSAENPVHFYQIWLLPEERGIEPSYEQKQFTEVEKRGRLRLVISPDGENGSMRIHQDARIYLSQLNSSDKVSYDLNAERRSWVQVLSGDVLLNNEPLSEGDGAAVSDEKRLTIEAKKNAEVMLFDILYRNTMLAYIRGDILVGSCAWLVVVPLDHAAYFKAGR